MSRLAGLPELTGVRKLWFSGWYDGPLTGIAVHDGREYWYVMVTGDEPGGHWDLDPRVFVLHRLTDEQLADEWEAHRSFAAAGLPGCLHSPACPEAGTGAEAVNAVRDRWPAEQEDAYREAPAIGWFRDA
ncbi:hypothetical protein Aab01nite_52780 [Paractinoplanes abujensis]|uniref:Uncharacterized protein n=1 Tax=Paractinoplanes abujensis TaxID=882441 RepID=A0A7W7G2H4_9ACTN|nr:hypothetical protein [Actinoplanes abujensis]MBB4693654.1 hypothetical protein [Actinoplanes abujensis]GID21688.1 hypothetical protein Aab01nite_52780 [Actinoplanes abujensis]